MNQIDKSDDEVRPENSENLPQFYSLCSECQTGILRLEYLTYFTWLNKELITVPNFPAWVCDVCGKREYDAHAVMRLNTLLSSEGKRRSLKGKGRRSGPRRIDRPLP
jgi:YgiT-type zinc finger domain-containing protein